MGRSRTWPTTPGSMSKEGRLWCQVSESHANPHDTVLALKRNGRTQDGQGGKIPQDSLGCSREV